MSRITLLAAAAAIALPLSAYAQRGIELHARTTGELAAMCAANPHDPGADARLNYCHGFAQGVVDVELKHGRPFCMPSPAPSRSATLHQFVEWVGQNSEHRGEDPVDGLMRFLRERFPCH